MTDYQRDFSTEPPIYEYGDSSFRRSFNESKEAIRKLSYQTLDWWYEQPLYKKTLFILIDVLFVLLVVLFGVYHETLIGYVVEYSDKWSQKPISAFIIGLMLFIISFPPLIGFSFTNTVAGAFYGVSIKGWLIIAVSSISGSVAAFVVFRYMLKSKAQALVSSNKKLFAFSTILQENNSFWLLTLIRLCPFPYSLTNGALAAIPGITITNFALGSIISSPKLVIYLFVGAKLKDFGKAKDTSTKLVDLASIVFTFIFLAITGWLLFTKTNQRIKELEAQRGLQPEGSNDLNEDFERFLENDGHADTVNLDAEFDLDNDYIKDTNANKKDDRTIV